MSEGGYIYVARHRPAGEPFRAGDIVDGYPVLEVVGDFRTESTPPLGSPSMTEDPHDVARHRAPQLIAELPNLRPVAQRGCDCRKKARSHPLTAGYVRDAHLWVIVEPQRFPGPVTDDVLSDRASGPSAWPAHVEPSGRPHVELTTCPYCRRQWAVLIDAEGFRFVRLGKPLYGVSVREG